MKAFSVELAGSNVQVNAIGPGRFHTSMTDDVFKDLATKDSFLKLIPMGRAGKPEELAGSVVYLASSASDYMTGQTLYVDGGWLAGGGNARS
jgi:NAD(P)-dependent dehydrogenase (short-subunit alcohol dehydrogenase family)